MSIRHTHPIFITCCESGGFRFAVDDCDAALERGRQLGGSTLFVHTVPKAGRIVSLSDAGGAVFVMRGPLPKRR